MRNNFYKFLKYKGNKSSELSELFIKTNREILQLTPQTQGYLTAIKEKKHILQELEEEIVRRGGIVVGGSLVVFKNKIKKKFLKTG
jgi:hypothetical protein